MDFYVILLRVTHILAGVFWAGAAFTLAGYVAPAAGAAGPEGAKFMQQLLGKTRLLSVIMVAAGLAALSGILLYWEASGHLRIEWITTGTGLALTLGGICGLAAATIGGLVQNRGSRKILALGQQIQASGGPPSPEQAEQLQRIQASVANGGLWTSILLVITILGMASSQYLFF